MPSASYLVFKGEIRVRFLDDGVFVDVDDPCADKETIIAIREAIGKAVTKKLNDTLEPVH